MKSKDKIPKGIAAALLAAVAVIAAKQLDKAPPPKVKVNAERLWDNPITRRNPAQPAHASAGSARPATTAATAKQNAPAKSVAAGDTADGFAL